MTTHGILSSIGFYYELLCKSDQKILDWSAQRMCSFLFSPRNFRCSIFKCFSFHLKLFYYFFNINNRLSVKSWKVKLVKQFQMYYKYPEQLLIKNTLEKLLCRFDLVIRSIRSKTIIDCELSKDVLARSFIVNEIQGELTLMKFLAQLIKKF